MDVSIVPEHDPAHCPICERPNDCGAARGETTCWCFTATIAPAVLARVPAVDVGMRCVCAACASAPAPTARLGESVDEPS